ncbi:enoyl-CoA hydratase-related protein [Streptomyces sp. NPDC008343]|uniref:enoyl-CoA hydratase-related protein n=1 Tax=Streptomyces sp. NPDC008343 TaxID=3364828 RepID=UPI0036E007CF
MRLPGVGGTGRKFGLNEVPIGIPMPSVYVRMLAYAWGEPVASRACLLGEIFSPAQAHALGMVHELAEGGEVVERAVEVAGTTPQDCIEQYAFTKRACQAAACGTSPTWPIRSTRSCLPG